jgi:hypothetical protein
MPMSALSRMLLRLRMSPTQKILCTYDTRAGRVSCLPERYRDQYPNFRGTDDSPLQRC